LREIAGCDWPDPSNQDVWSVTTSIEGLLQLDPDVILVSDWAGQFADEKTMREELGKRPLWKELTAFREGRVFLEPSGLNLDGMGTIGAARMLDYFAPLIYPEVFPAPLTEEEVREIAKG
jgi:ABC-type Fe3+-hydroxamate transport system substrate-binding protein